MKSYYMYKMFILNNLAEWKLSSVNKYVSDESYMIYRKLNNNMIYRKINNNKINFQTFRFFKFFTRIKIFIF